MKKLVLAKGEAVTVTETGRVHYAALDGLRGVAALMVVLFHQSQTLLEGSHIQHAYLAVDFFFILSGFVISFAYTERLASTMSKKRFVLERAIRLFPLLLLGGLFGASYLITAGTEAETKGGIGGVLLQFIFAVFTLPFPFRSISESPYGLNGPAWSLFFEIIANFIFALGLFKISNRKLITVTTILVCLRVLAEYKFSDSFWNHLNIKSSTFGTIQVLSTFCLGMLLERVGIAGRIKRLSAPFIVQAILLVLILCVPLLGSFDIAFKIFAVYITFPLIIISACQNALPPKWTRLAAFSGAISYPLYILHLPLLSWLYFASIKLNFVQVMASAKIFCFTAVCCAIALAADRLYDRPIRKSLKRLTSGS